MVQFIFLKCNWRKGAKSIPKANLRCNFKLRVDFQESDKYLQRTRAHVRSSVLRWLGHLENSTASQPPTELRTRICTTRIKLLRTGLGPEVWGELILFDSKRSRLDSGEGLAEITFNSYLSMDRHGGQLTGALYEGNGGDGTGRKHKSGIWPESTEEVM